MTKSSEISGKTLQHSSPLPPLTIKSVILFESTFGYFVPSILCDVGLIPRQINACQSCQISNLKYTVHFKLHSHHHFLKWLYIRLLTMACCLLICGFCYVLGKAMLSSNETQLNIIQIMTLIGSLVTVIFFISVGKIFIDNQDLVDMVNFFVANTISFGNY